MVSVATDVLLRVSKWADPLSLAVGAGLLILYCLVNSQAIWSTWKRRPCETRGEWEIVGEHAARLSSNVAESKGHLPASDREKISDETWDILRHVLREAPGEIDRDEMLDSLDSIRDQGESSASGFQSLASQAVLTTLLATVLMFVLLFWPNAGQQSVNVDALRKHVPAIYAFNALGLAAALTFMFLARRSRARAEDNARAARVAFREFRPTSDDRDLQRLKPTLDELQKKLEEANRNFVDHLGRRMGDVVSQLDGVKTAVVTLGERFISTTGTNPLNEMAALQAVHADVRRLATSMDEGIRGLAQPFLQGIPAMGKLTAAAEKLDETATALLSGDPRAILARLEAGARAVTSVITAHEHSLQGLPAACREAVSGAVSGASETLASRVEGTLLTVKDAASRLDQSTAGLHASLAELPTHVGRSVVEALSKSEREVAGVIGRATEQALDKQLGPAIKDADAVAIALQGAANETRAAGEALATAIKGLEGRFEAGSRREQEQAAVLETLKKLAAEMQRVAEVIRQSNGSDQALQRVAHDCRTAISLLQEIAEACRRRGLFGWFLGRSRS